MSGEPCLGPILVPAAGRWPAEIAVWHLNIPLGDDDIAQSQPALWAVLDDAEQQRARRYRLAADAARFVATRACLRILLATHLAVNPRNLRFTVSEHGRPVLAQAPDLSFNVSHAGPHALIALSVVHRVGVDVEWIDSTLDWTTLWDLVCTPRERHAILQCRPEAQGTAFFRCWTAKEAVLKAWGLGIANGLLAVSVDPGAEGIQTVTGSGDSPGGPSKDDTPFPLRFHWLTDFPGFMGCIAYDDVRRDASP